MRTSGINLILADSHDTVKSICQTLGLDTVYPLSALPTRCMVEPDAVYFALGTTREELLQLSSFFNIRRGVICIAGKDEYLGSNVDWMTKLLVRKNERAAVASIRTFTPQPVEDDEKESPYEALGYARR